MKIFISKRTGLPAELAKHRRVGIGKADVKTKNDTHVVGQ